MGQLLYVKNKNKQKNDGAVALANIFAGDSPTLCPNGIEID